MPTIDEQITTAAIRRAEAIASGRQSKVEVWTEVLSDLRDRKRRGELREQLREPVAVGLQSVGRFLTEDGTFPLAKLQEAAAADPTFRQRNAQKWAHLKEMQRAEAEELREIDRDPDAV
jgi:hypothetical protein